MKFKCPDCGEVFKRDIRQKIVQNFLTKKKGVYFYTSICIKNKDKHILCREAK